MSKKRKFNGFEDAETYGDRLDGQIPRPPRNASISDAFKGEKHHHKSRTERIFGKKAVRA